MEDSLVSNSYKMFNLNDVVKIEKSLDSLGSDSSFCIILSTEGRGLIEMSEEEVDFADKYVLRAVTDKEKKSSAYKTFLTVTGMTPYEPEYGVATLF